MRAAGSIELTPLECRILLTLFRLGRDETEGRLHLLRTFYCASDFAECVGLKPGELRRPESAGKYGSLRNSLASLKSKRLLTGCKGEYRFNPDGPLRPSDIKSMGPAPPETRSEKDAYQSILNLSAHLKNLGLADLQVHNVSLEFDVLGLHSFLTDKMEVHTLPDNWRYIWDKDAREGNRKFVRGRFGMNQGGLREVGFAVNTSDKVECYVTSSRAPFNFDFEGLCELLETLIQARSARALRCSALSNSNPDTLFRNMAPLRAETLPAFKSLPNLYASAQSLVLSFRTMSSSYSDFGIILSES